MKLRLLLSGLILTTFLHAQEKDQYRKNQYLLDMNHSGMGITLYRPALGKLANFDSPWVDVNFLSDVLEFRMGFGRVNARGVVPSGFSYTESVNDNYFGSNVYIGVSVPVNLLNFGAQTSPHKEFRGHPVLGGGFGWYNFINEKTWTRKHDAQIAYFALNPGYRVRLPFGSIEGNLNMRLGITVGTEDNRFKGSGIYPSVTLRLNALKWKYNPDMVTVQGAAVSMSNVQTTERHVGTSYTQTSRIDTYERTTTADVTVTPMNIGVQDIGKHFGIGPKFSFMNPKRSPYIPTSRMLGVVAEGRGGVLSLGLTVEGGRVGTGGKLKIKDDSEHTYHRQLARGETDGLGEISTVNVYTQIGMDISPLFLVPFGIAIDKGEATSFMSVIAGFNFGGHISWNPEFLEPAKAEAKYEQVLAEDNGETKEKYLNPAAAKSGYLGGFFIAAEVGACSFKVTNYRYYGAPFASTTMLSLAYRIPVLHK